MRVETRANPCGLLSYAALDVPHDWRPAPLNRCDCGKEIARWTAMLGHVCECGKQCNGKCRPGSA